MSTEAFLSSIETDEAPPPDLLAGAAFLDGWEFSLSDTSGSKWARPLCLGTVRDHPVIPDASGAVLSALLAVDKARTWVRDATGYFKLGIAKRWWPLSEVVTARDWARGLLNVLDEDGWPGEARGAALALDASLDDWPKRRQLAKEIRHRLEHHKRQALADAFRVLEADITVKHDCAVVVGLIEQAIGAREIDVLDGALEGWRILGSGFYIGAEKDPVVAARQVAEVSASNNDETAIRIIANLKTDIATLKARAVTPDDLMRMEDRIDEHLEEQKRPGAVVVPALGGVEGAMAKEVKAAFEPMVGRKIPAYPVPDIAKAKTVLVGEFPHAESLVNVLLSDLPGRPHIKFQNTLIVGPPGCGKSRFARRIGEALGVHVGSFDAAGTSDAAYGGTGRRWSSGEPCWPLIVIKASGHANPLVLVDEIDKAGTSRHNGSLYSSILTLLEPETAAKFSDPYIQAQVDVSNVSHILTCNDDKNLPAPLKDRCRVLRMPPIKPEHVPAIARGIVVDLFRERGLDARWVTPLDGDEIEIAMRMLGDGSIRRLRVVVERLLARRETSAQRN